MDTLMFCKLLNMDKAGFDKRIAKAKQFSPYRASIFEKQISDTVYARFQEHLYEYSGFYVQKRTIRNYPDSIAAQFLGYVNEVTERDLERSNGFYRPNRKNKRLNSSN